MTSSRPIRRLVALLGIGAGVLATPALAATPSEAVVDPGTPQALVDPLDRMPLLVGRSRGRAGRGGGVCGARAGGERVADRLAAPTSRLHRAGEIRVEATPRAWWWRSTCPGRAAAAGRRGAASDQGELLHGAEGGLANRPAELLLGPSTASRGRGWTWR